MEILNNTFIERKSLPVKVVQFGDGNFLRGFANYIIDLLNEKGFNCGVAVVKNRPGSMEVLKSQDGLFTLFTEGIKNGTVVQQSRVVTCITKIVNPFEDYNAYLALAEEPELKIVVSNTTEAGIVFCEKDNALSQYPHYSFGAKLTALLYRRFIYFSADAAKGCIMLPCELVEHNADKLKNIVLQYAEYWQLGTDFVSWINNCNQFYNTLVDRIVPGYPKENTAQYTNAMPYKDALITVCEPYLFWAIEADENLLKHFPVDGIDEEIIVVPQIAPYRLRKVRILNGLHTLLAQVARLLGKTTVRQSLEDDFCLQFISGALEQEILKTLPLPYNECTNYAAAVLDRFRNPFLHHRLTDIALNSVSKFNARLLPVIEDYYKAEGVLPKHLVYALACLMHIYKSSAVPRFDEDRVLQAFDAIPEYNIEAVTHILATHFTTAIPLALLARDVATALAFLEAGGVQQGFTQFNNHTVVV